MGGKGAKIALGGLSLLDGARHADTTLLVDHAAPHGRSREFYKHIVADEATGVYQGKVVVRPGAQKTDGAMKSQAILLSPHAVMNNKPELEIFADDVVCGHGATVGALDPEQMFYLQARGLPKAEAEAMLLEAFGADAIARVEDEDLAELLRAQDARVAGGADGRRALMTMHNPLPCARRRGAPRRLPHSRRAPLWQAAGLPRQRRLGAEAAAR